ncbi:hypothetical protein [Arenimonas fontis]|uniref:General secretion pathway protein GspN n=1 Tax=Arenimonas fontis TaxID=2608255 RepID=A0A5B2ZAC8_9GAMM|nr:hypothetical protein [Arenimonas fontis]KAA2284979.1 hypothetical protein F0415_06940 [Arenimonas fontis]
MIESLRPGNAFAAALAAWSAALLLLALAGLGGRSGPLPDDPAMRPPLPRVELREARSRLGPLADYGEVGARPLLSFDRRPAPMARGEQAEDSLESLVLSSVLIVGDTRLALLQPSGGGETRKVRLGEAVPGTAWRLVELAPRLAVFEGPEGRRELALRVFDGRGAGVPAAGPDPVRDESAGPDPGRAATPAPVGDEARAAPASQEAQVEAIRRRIEARRAQMRAEAEARERGEQVE